MESWFDTGAYLLPTVVAGDVWVEDPRAGATAALMRFRNANGRGYLLIYGEQQGEQESPTTSRLPAERNAAQCDVYTASPETWQAGFFDYTPTSTQPGFIQPMPLSPTGLLGKATYRLVVGERQQSRKVDLIPTYLLEKMTRQPVGRAGVSPAWQTNNAAEA